MDEMDTRGIYDAMTRNVSSLHGLRSSRGGYELTMSVQLARKIATVFRWVNGMMQLGDCLTKFGERKVFLQFLANQQRWKLIHDEQFTAGRKVRKREFEKSLKSQEETFMAAMATFARMNCWHWDDEDPRSMGDESCRLDMFEHPSIQVPIGIFILPGSLMFYHRRAGFARAQGQKVRRPICICHELVIP